MLQLVASALAFTFGLLFLPLFFSDIRLRRATDALTVGALGGLLSAVLGRVLWIIVSTIVFPIGLLGPVGAFLTQAVVNLGLFAASSRWVLFKRLTSRFWAALTLTVLQTIAQWMA